MLHGAKFGKSGKVKKPKRLNIENVVAIASGTFHVLMLTKGKELYGIGENRRNQLKVGESQQFSAPTKLHWNEGETFPVTISSGYSHGMIIDSSGCLWTFGSNHRYQTGTPTNALTRLEEVGFITDCSRGGNHVLIKNSSGEIWVWGDSDCGQLGEPRNFPKPERFDPQYDFIIGRPTIKVKSARK